MNGPETNIDFGELNVTNCFCGCHYALDEPEGCDHCKPQQVLPSAKDSIFGRVFIVPDLGIERPLSAILADREEALKRNGYMSVYRGDRF